MKQHFIAFMSLVLAASFLASCNKDQLVDTPTQVGRSKVTFYPLVAIKGDHLIILKQGDTFTDPGVDATVNGTAVTPVINGSVNTAAGGVYNLTYAASNSDGFSASDWRTVVVIGNDVAANDFSGTYKRGATGVTSTWTKTASGVYNVENPGGAGAGVGLMVIAVNYTGNKIAIPKQDSPDFGVVSSGSETYTPGSPAQYSWIFFAGGYGTSLRTFVKQ